MTPFDEPPVSEVAPEEDDYLIRHLRFEMTGFDAPFLYRVGKADWERVYTILFNCMTEGFLAFEGLDGRNAAVNISKIKRCIFLWDAPIGMRSEPVRPRAEVEIYFEGEKEPYSLYVDRAIELTDALTYLQGEDEPFFILTDVDGERIAFGSRHVLVIDCSTEVEDEGHKEIMREYGAEDDVATANDEDDLNEW